jgi:ankyrin repeat-rich membrane spanning protein
LTCLREAAPLLELDRDERKLDAFLQLHKSDLLVSDLRIFLPFTINLDPYLRKVLKGKTVVAGRRLAKNTR